MDQIHEYENMVSEIIGEGIVLCEYMQANVLIEKLPSPSRDEYKKHLRQKKKDMKLQELIGHIKIEDATRSQDRARTNATNTVKANVVEYRNTGKNKRSYDQYNKAQNSDKSIKTMTGNCWWCDKPGHSAFKCKAKKAYEERQQNQGNRNNAHGGKFQKKDNNQRGGYKNYKSNKPQANVVEGSSEGDGIIAAMVSEINLDLYKELKDVDEKEVVYVGNSSKVPVLDIGKVHLKLTSGKVLALENVLYVPDMRRNLISGALLNKAGLKLTFEFDKLVMSKNG
ncbi:uncharacterized protein LOC141641726 [Silene latifolia]|uniref:uncharacterized protein LOC141641726 n=1 Tax=Silene latifolia TaxID=37657 RepID=UPI003D785DA6